MASHFRLNSPVSMTHTQLLDRQTTRFRAQLVNIQARRCIMVSHQQELFRMLITPLPTMEATEVASAQAGNLILPLYHHQILLISATLIPILQAAHPCLLPLALLITLVRIPTFLGKALSNHAARLLRMLRRIHKMAAPRHLRILKINRHIHHILLMVI
jgi:hypothetical protein